MNYGLGVRIVLCFGGEVWEYFFYGNLWDFVMYLVISVINYMFIVNIRFIYLVELVRFLILNWGNSIIK